MKKIVKYIGLVFVFSMLLFAAKPVLASDCGSIPECNGTPGEEDGMGCCPKVPFDGGITLMLAAGGIGMGVKAMRKRKISNQLSEDSCQ